MLVLAFLASLRGTPREKIQEQFDVNVFGVMEVTKSHPPALSAKPGRHDSECRLRRRRLWASHDFALLRKQVCLGGLLGSALYEVAAQGIAVKIIEPGGILSTSFHQRSRVEAGQVEALPDYDAFVKHTGAVFEGLVANARATEEEVARVIFGAATDGTHRLRYVATKDIAPLVQARRETSEENLLGTDAVAIHHGSIDRKWRRGHFEFQRPT